MDPQFTATREELYHVQMDVKHVQAVQINHADRLLRLEKRQADDAALKSVWGTGSPFPSVLSGTPQHGKQKKKKTITPKSPVFNDNPIGPVPNPVTDVFDDFDDEQGQNLLGSLQLEADEEPVRRGASRANSVRFDVSALQGSNWAQGSRSSGEFGPTRPSSGFGSHPMTERSLSHKSDGRHSSAGHSVHSVPSGRTSSLGLDTNFVINGQDVDSPLDIPDPPPGLFILGSVPSIIRCWLSANFSHNALLYAVICTGSQKSALDYSLVRELGMLDRLQKDSSNSCYKIRLPVYLPEAIITQPSSRSNSPAPQLPALTVDFEVIGLNQHTNADGKKGIRVFIGSDTLRAHNADVIFSQNLLSLYCDDRNKLSVPFVRPEDERLFKNLRTFNILTEKNELKATAQPFMPTEHSNKTEPPDTGNAPFPLISAIATSNKAISDADLRSPTNMQSESPITTPFTSSNNGVDRDSGVGPETSDGNNSSGDSEKQNPRECNAAQSGMAESSPSDASRRESSSGIWGSWRQGSASIGGENEPTSGYQRATRGGRSMKVLKPSKSISSTTTVTNRSSSAARTGAAYDPAPSRTSGEFRRKIQVGGGAENLPARWESKKFGSSEEQKGSRAIATIPRSSNPVGGASAFAWMNSAGKPKASATAE